MKNNLSTKITLLLASMLTMMANTLISPALPSIENAFSFIDNIEFWAKQLISLPGIFIALFSPFAGKIVDRYGRRKLLIASLIIYFIAGTAGAYVENFYLLLASRLVLGVAVGGLLNVLIVLSGDYYQGKELDSFLGIQGAFVGLGSFLFTFLAGMLIDVNWRYSFWLFSFAGIILFLCIKYVKEPVIAYKKEVADEKTKFPTALFVLINFVAFIGVAAYFMVPTQLPFLLNRLEGMDATLISVQISCFALSQALFSLFYRPLKGEKSYAFMYFLTYILIAVGFIGIYLSSSYLWLLISVIVTGLGFGFFIPNGNLWVMAITPLRLRGLMIGILAASSYVGMALSSILVEPIVQYVSIEATFLFMGGISLIFSIYFLFYKYIGTR